MAHLRRGGNIIARLTIADNDFLSSMLVAAEKAGAQMLPGDVESRAGWAKFVTALRNSPSKSQNQLNTGFTDKKVLII